MKFFARAWYFSSSDEEGNDFDDINNCWRRLSTSRVALWWTKWQISRRRRSESISLLLLPRCLFYTIVISAVFLLPSLVVRAFKEFAFACLLLGKFRVFANSSVWFRTQRIRNDRIIEKRVFRIVRTRLFCEDQKCLAIARFDYSKMRVYAPRRRALVVPAPESGKP